MHIAKIFILLGVLSCSKNVGVMKSSKPIQRPCIQANFDYINYKHNKDLAKEINQDLSLTDKTLQQYC